jgi:hypothetical protein
MIEINYNGNNLEFLEELKSRLDYIDFDYCLFRASEFEEVVKILKYGTDRVGFPPKNWEDTDIPYENVIYAMTEEDIITAEIDKTKSSSFKKFDIIDNPILILYDINGFKKIGDRQWIFLEPGYKSKYLMTIIKVIK